MNHKKELLRGLWVCMTTGLLSTFKKKRVQSGQAPILVIRD